MNIRKTIRYVSPKISTKRIKLNFFFVPDPSNSEVFQDDYTSGGIMLANYTCAWCDQPNGPCRTC